MTAGTPSLNKPVTETEAQARIRTNKPGGPATVKQMAAGAAITGVYHPPVMPWEGHCEDVVFNGDPTRPNGADYRLVMLFGAGAIFAIVVGALIAAVG